MEAVPPKPKLTPPRPRSKPQLTPPMRHRRRAGKAPIRARLILFTAFVVVALGAVGVVVLLPREIAQHDPIGSSEPPEPDAAPANPPNEAPIEALRETAEATLPVASPGDSDGDQSTAPQDREGTSHQIGAKVEAEGLLRETLQLQAALEADGVGIWGQQRSESSYPDALETLSLANAQFDAGQFDEAVERYRETLSLLGQLQASRPERLLAAVQAGTQALERADDQAAKDQFEIALALDPANATAEHGLTRAENLPAVLELVRQGLAFEEDADLDRARRAYAQAAALDGDYQPAQENLRRLDETILARDYQSALSDALRALEHKDFEQAQRALDRAEQLRPNASEVLGIRQEVQAASQIAALERIRQMAARHEKEERWDDALQAYEQALGIDGQANFAIRGKARAAEFSQLTQQLDFYLADPDRLQSPEPRAHARAVVEAAGSRPSAGGKIREKQERLRNLVDTYSTPRPVVLHSDGKTDVTLYRVKRFGQFSELRVTLLAGLYTAVGTREGYRDVRIQFRVPPRNEETTVVIRCEEKI